MQTSHAKEVADCIPPAIALLRMIFRNDILEHSRAKIAYKNGRRIAGSNMVALYSHLPPYMRALPLVNAYAHGQEDTRA